MASSCSVRLWRTAFLSLRDETLTPLSRPLPDLLCSLIFSQTQVLVEAAPELPPHEVASDLVLLMELLAACTKTDKLTDALTQACYLIHDVNHRVRLQISLSSWAPVLDFLEKVIHWCLPRDAKRIDSSFASILKTITEALEVFRNCPIAESSKLVKLLLQVISSILVQLSVSYSGANHRFNNTMPHYQNLWEVQTRAFVLIGDIFSRIGSSVSNDVWQATLQVIRKVMDLLESKNLLIEDHTMSRFYTSLLRCLHLVLSDPKGPILEHVAGIVASLQMFFVYGLTSKFKLDQLSANKEPQSLNSGVDKTGKSKSGGAYKPPHMRKREETSSQHLKAYDCNNFSPDGSTSLAFNSSDSELSDNDGSVNITDRFRCSKARIAAITCIQDLCQTDPKSLTAHWTLLLPINDVLQPRRYQATLMTCLLFDPVLKARIASASTLAAMLDGSVSVYLQVAEYKEPAKCGSFTTLPSSLGQVLKQLHAGLSYLVQHERNSGLLASLFKVLTLLITATPYPRMPGELLPNIISTVIGRILEDFALKTDQINLLAISLSCLGAAVSTSPPSMQVAAMIRREIATGAFGAPMEPYLISVLFRFSRGVHPLVGCEALQAVRAAIHNYPTLMTGSWDLIDATVSGILLEHACLHTMPAQSSIEGDTGNASGFTPDKYIMVAIKVLDEYLRAASGFKGTDDSVGDELLESPFLLDCSRMPVVSSAPHYRLDGLEPSKSGSQALSSGVKLWSESIEKYLPFGLLHGSPMVRTASVTCFAGMTSSVYYSLTTDKQEFVMSNIVKAAKDEVPSVRSAACRAIGVISCFPLIFDRAVVLEEFLYSIEINSCDLLISVRIPASWALANICDSLRHTTNDFPLESCFRGLSAESVSESLFECALRLTADGDKVKSNAVRALGNLARFIKFSEQSSGPPNIVKQMSSSGSGVDNRQQSINGVTAARVGDHNWSERMVQAFVSCVTTGNVKVQWNVCRALASLFQNNTLRLEHTPWAPSVYSILLLLLRESTNFKIRIHAAAALAVPASRADYGSSFADVVQGVELVLENLSSNPILAPSSFKYFTILEKQLTSTILHVIGFASSDEAPPLKDFLAKKAYFLEDWFKKLCSELKEDTTGSPTAQSSDMQNDRSLRSIQKKEMIIKAIQSLVSLFKGSNQQNLAQRLQKLAECMS